MRGARSLSTKLEEVIEEYSPDRLDLVIREALIYVSREYANDAEIEQTISSIAIPITTSPSMQSRCDELSRKADETYTRLEDTGKLEESKHEFRRMCVFNGLANLFSSESLERNVDEMLYDMGHGAESTDLFVDTLIRNLST